MNFYNPILVKEMRTRMRGKRAFIILTGYLVVLSLFIGLIYVLVVRNAPVWVANQTGPILAPVLIHFQMGLICLVAPTFAASAISSEREQQTFDLLLVSLARPATIVFGKIGAALSYLLLTLFGSLPLMSLVYSLGGVSLSDIALAYLVMFVAGVTYCSISFFWSTLIRRSVVAQLVGILTVVLLVAGIPAITLLLSIIGSRLANGPSTSQINLIFFLLRTNPFAAVAKLVPGFPMPSGSWWASIQIWVTQVLFYLVLTTLSILLSLRRLRNVRNWL